MKRKIISVLTLFFCFMTFCKAQNYSTQEELNKIADDTQECIDTNYVTDYTMALCVIEGTNKYELKINNVIVTIKRYLPEVQYQQFLNRQKKWEKSLKKYDNKIQNTPCPPYQPYLFAVNDKYLYVKNRAIYLNNFLERLLK